MGSIDFCTRVKNRSAKRAFNEAVKNAKHNYGHGGYTGTIAEKSDFVIIKVPADTTVRDYINKLFDDDDSPIADKWGPAGAIQDGDEWVFFGWASC
jgi:hypothetical protein